MKPSPKSTLGLHALKGILSVAMAASAFLSATAFADPNCNALIADKINTIVSRGVWYNVQMTMHRSDVNFVSFSEGFLAYDSINDRLSGRSNQLFSDRRSAGAQQPFDFNAADQLSWDLTRDGRLHIRYETWGFDTYWNMTCLENNILTFYQPFAGIYTLTFRDTFYPIQ